MKMSMGCGIKLFVFKGICVSVGVWEVVCQPRDKGGLGERDVNMILLAK